MPARTMYASTKLRQNDEPTCSMHVAPAWPQGQDAPRARASRGGDELELLPPEREILSNAARSSSAV